MFEPLTRLRRRGTARRTAVTFAAALAVPLLALSTGTRVDTARADNPNCSWRLHVQAGVPGVALPDSNADYWITPYKLANGQQLELKGKFPSARYMSFNTYDAQGLSVVNGSFSSSLPDVNIVPDAGSVNPWNVAASKPYGAYTVRVRNTSLGSTNTIPATKPIANGTSEFGFLIIRMYVRPPAESGQYPSPESAELPTMKYYTGTRWRNVKLCAVKLPIDGQQPLIDNFPRIAEKMDSWADAAAPPPTAETLKFARAAVEAPFFPNNDTAYVGNAYKKLRTGEVLVVRGKAPTHQFGTAPTVRDGEQLRYWSICNYTQEFWFPVVINYPFGEEPVVGCKRDGQIKLDASRIYTVVVGTEYNRPRIEGLDWGGVTDYASYIPFKQGSSDTHSLQLRHTLPSSGFRPKSTLNVAEGATAAQTEAVMQEYYPKAKLCQFTSLRDLGPVNCKP